MLVYYGVVHAKSIELESDTQLAEGTPVEVRLRPLNDAATGGAAVRARLRAAGLLAPASQTDDTDTYEDFVPVVAQGEPLSTQLLRERR